MLCSSSAVSLDDGAVSKDRGDAGHPYISHVKTHGTLDYTRSTLPRTRVVRKNGYPGVKVLLAVFPSGIELPGGAGEVLWAETA